MFNWFFKLFRSKPAPSYLCGVPEAQFDAKPLYVNLPPKDFRSTMRHLSRLITCQEVLDKHSEWDEERRTPYKDEIAARTKALLDAEITIPQSITNQRKMLKEMTEKADG